MIVEWALIIFATIVIIVALIAGVNQLTYIPYQTFIINDDDTQYEKLKQRLDSLGIKNYQRYHDQVALWSHIVEHKLGWTLIVTDDILRSWKLRSVPKEVKILYPGHWKSYMICEDGAQYLLDNLLPITEPVDTILTNHFKDRTVSIIRHV